MRKAFPEGRGMDAGLTKLQILGVWEAVVLGPGCQVCVCLCAGLSGGKIGWGWIAENFACPVVLSRVQVWLLKQGDPNKSGLNNTADDVSNSSLVVGMHLAPNGLGGTWTQPLLSLQLLPDGAFSPQSPAAYGHLLIPVGGKGSRARATLPFPSRHSLKESHTPL